MLSIQPHTVFKKSPPLAVQLAHAELADSDLDVVAFVVVDGVAGEVDNCRFLPCLRLATEPAVTVTVGTG